MMYMSCALNKQKNALKYTEIDTFNNVLPSVFRELVECFRRLSARCFSYEDAVNIYDLISRWANRHQILWI